MQLLRKAGSAFSLRIPQVGSKVMAEEAEEQNGAIVPRQEWPELNKLTKVWEGELAIRQSFREHGHLLVWPKKELVGTASLKTLSMNRSVVAEGLRVWCQACSTPKSPPIDWLKQEALEGKIAICLSLYLYIPIYLSISLYLST